MKEAKLLPKELTWDDVIRNIQPVAPLAHEAWERSQQNPAASAFTEKSQDMRGPVMWNSDSFTRK
jgi:hypothetical protein